MCSYRTDHGGDITTFMRTDIPVRRRLDIECTTLENIVYEITLDKTKWSVYALYCPPSMTIYIFYDSFNILQDKVSTFVENYMVIGDLSNDFMVKNKSQVIYVFNGWLYFLVRSDIDNSSISVEVTDIFRDQDYVLKPLQPFERTISWEIYRHNSSNSWSYTRFDAKFDDDKLPVCRGIYYRVEGENVVITCKINNTYGLVEVNEGSTINCMSFPVFDHVQWYLGNGLTTGSLKVSHKIKPNNILEFTLRITDLKAEKFKHEITLWGLFNQEETLRVKFESFFINKQKEISKCVHVPQGHIVSYNAMPFYSFPLLIHIGIPMIVLVFHMI
ncbi:unnamed protein product [Mytilus edulis]|uniref:Uncharacterized protein n=1 Tax=Mytilus edulis TaxID=6550 RepID=A0A8S3R9X2_MYTED|nr:unnamed protein product [Mytilus edulis]